MFSNFFLIIAAALLRYNLASEVPDTSIKDGHISMDEFMIAFYEASQNVRGTGRFLQRVPAPVKSSFRTEEQGMVDIDTLRGNISKLIKGDAGAKNGYESCAALFKAFDSNDDGKLNPSELTNMFQAGGNSAQEANTLTRTMMYYYDRNKDSSLSMPELIAACKGDPHFITWYGSHYSYHGACDLVLVQNPSFASGKGLDLHVRTEHMLEGAFSYISNAALRIGEDILEIVSDGSHYLNGEKDTELPSRVGGFPITKRVKESCHGTHGCSYATIFNVALMGQDSIQITVASNMIHVDVAGSDANFQGSAGLMGTYPAMHHGKIARDGVSYIRDPNEFAEEWQVLESEVQLFRDSRFPRHPQQCTPAVKTVAAERHLQMAEDKEGRTAAEEACAHVPGSELEFCIFDVLATGDYGMASIIYG